MENIIPVIKWVGGKTQIMSDVFALFPKEISTYYEPFIGGGSVLFELLNRLERNEIKVTNICISDINKNLIDLYNCIKNNEDELLQYLHKFKKKYDQAPINNNNEKRKKIVIFKTMKENKEASKEHLYYFYRKIFNKLKMTNENNVKKSALFIFLNKTSFRGVYRENLSGFFNVPFGNYEKLEMFTTQNIKRCSELFNKYNVSFVNIHFINLIGKIKFDKNTFVYLDPPYYPENETSFTSYTSDDFNKEQHVNLTNLCKFINQKNSKFLLSNSDTKFIKDNLKEFHIKIINCKRQINSKNPGATTNEVLIYN
jgi:DNA adenine methylase